MSGADSYYNGLAAEEAVARRYVAAGLTVAARRWRGRSGEIDLIFRQGRTLVFVEVKQGRDFARAAERLSMRQLERIWAAAGEFLGSEPAGQDSDVRVDAALVDDLGRIDIIEGITLH